MAWDMGGDLNELIKPQIRYAKRSEVDRAWKGGGGRSLQCTAGQWVPPMWTLANVLGCGLC